MAAKTYSLINRNHYSKTRFLLHPPNYAQLSFSLSMSFVGFAFASCNLLALYLPEKSGIYCAVKYHRLVEGKSGE